MFSPRSIVNVCSGGVKYQLTSRMPLTAERSAGQRPPSAAVHDDEQQEEEEDARQPDLPAQVGEHVGEHGRSEDGEHEAERDAPLRQRGGPARPREREGFLGRVRVADDVDVDPRAGPADHLPDHRAFGQALPPRAPARAHHDLRHVQRARRVEEGVADVLADDLVVARAELADELPLALEQLRGRRREPVLRNHVDGDELAVHPLCHARGPPDQALAVGRPGQRHEHPLAGLPGLLDPVAPAVLLEALVHPVGEPGEGELAQRREVARPEVVGERGIDPLGRVDVASREPVAQRDRGQVDELELVCPAHDLVGDRLLLLDTGDLLDDVVQRLDVLDVERPDDRDPRLEQLLDVLPALLVA